MTSSDEISASTIQTYSGEMFDSFNPDPGKINLQDISHALSMICRYGGHSRVFYSVAEHSALMARYFAEKGVEGIALMALFHDASEAYMGDVVRPLKLQMPLYRQVEENLRLAIFEKFGFPLDDLPDLIKDADLRICNDERAVLLLDRPWSAYIDALQPLGVEIQAWSPDQAKSEWLETYWGLIG